VNIFLEELRVVKDNLLAWRQDLWLDVGVGD
jgi:hypothetical protein